MLNGQALKLSLKNGFGDAYLVLVISMQCLLICKELEECSLTQDSQARFFLHCPSSPAVKAVQTKLNLPGITPCCLKQMILNTSVQDTARSVSLRKSSLGPHLQR